MWEGQSLLCHHQPIHYPDGGWAALCVCWTGSGFGGAGGGRRREEEVKTPNVVIPLRVSLRQLYTGDILETVYVRQVLYHRTR